LDQEGLRSLGAIRGGYGHSIAPGCEQGGVDEYGDETILGRVQGRNRLRRFDRAVIAHPAQRYPIAIRGRRRLREGPQYDDLALLGQVDGGVELALALAEHSDRRPDGQ